MAEMQIDFEKASALVIGITGYTHIRPLPQVDDAKDIAAVLKSEEFCGYRKLETLVEDEATKDRILDELDKLAKPPPKNTVLIYFSGHGGWIKEGAQGAISVAVRDGLPDRRGSRQDGHSQHDVRGEAEGHCPEYGAIDGDP